MMKILFFTTLLLVASCSKAPLFNPEDNNDTRIFMPILRESNFGKQKIGIQWIQGPQSVTAGESIFKLRMWNASSGSVYGPYELPENKVCVFLWMVMPDGSEHGASPLAVEVEKNDDGDILVIKEAFFVMSGAWLIRVRQVEEKTVCKSTKDFEYINEAIFAVRVD